ncbi:hypothetical protein [Dasania marina]|uniref:hypothetical protein n=1 Tax=Dasania marina TaxID=471499 RepID=UPI000366C372|nr:hypothetical protein [Dasania marina]
MKLHKTITVDGQPLKLVNDTVRLSLKTPGTANFVVQASTPLQGIVQFNQGYSPKNLAPYFTGFIETSNRVDKNQQRIFCRELPAVLAYPIKMALRNVSLSDVLAVITKKTGLNFTLNHSSNKLLPFFYAMGSGYHNMENLGLAFGIEQYLWQQQPDGNIYVGSLANAPFNKTIAIPDNYFTNHGVANRAKMALIEKTRPGLNLEGRGIITTVESSGQHMLLSWNKNPWM